MIANYGYKDGSGDFFIAIDTDKCDGCGACIPACPNGVFIVGEDPNDPLRDEPVAVVGELHRKKLKYTCAQCKPQGSVKSVSYRSPELPCVQACKPLAISHSW
jgi:ferredoxin